MTMIILISNDRSNRIKIMATVVIVYLMKRDKNDSGLPPVFLYRSVYPILLKVN